MAQFQFSGFTRRYLVCSNIRNLYYRLRGLRNHQKSQRRQIYRLILKNKAVLIADGLDKEVVRLWCRQWSACHPEAARERFLAYCEKNSIIFENTHNE